MVSLQEKIAAQQVLLLVELRAQYKNYHLRRSTNTSTIYRSSSHFATPLARKEIQGA